MTAKQVEKNIQEIWEMFKENERRFKENERRFKETERVIEQASLQIEKTGKQVEKTSREIAEVGKRVDALTGKWGRFVEGLVVPAVERLFQQRGIPVDKVSQRVKARKNGRGMEIDILAINQGYVLLIEAKSTLSVDDVNDHLQNLSEFKFFFPEYADRKVVGAVAGIVIDEGAGRYAYKSGLFVIGQSGETVKILNDEKFVPRTW